MTTTRTISENLTVAFRGRTDPSTQYEYALIMDLRGPFPGLLRQVGEAAAKEILAGRRTASWSWLDDGALAVHFTRGTPETAANIAVELLETLPTQLEKIRTDADDPAFDEAFAAVTD